MSDTNRPDPGIPERVGTPSPPQRVGEVARVPDSKVSRLEQACADAAQSLINHVMVLAVARYGLEKLRKDRHAHPGDIAEAAQTFRACEAQYDEATEKLVQARMAEIAHSDPAVPDL